MTDLTRLERMQFRRRALAVVAFAAAMGYLEAACVVYLQRAIGMTPAQLFPVRDASTLNGLAGAELAREVATLVMLWGIGWLAGSTGLQRFAWTAVAFGVWDIVYYMGLVALIGWPTSLGAWDLLFMIPAPWAGPVWAPLLVSVALIGFGLAYARRDDLQLRSIEWAALVLGGAIVVLAFCWNATLVLDKGVPTTFPVALYAVGMTIGCAAAIRPLRRH